jgi:hypothetical protein
MRMCLRGSARSQKPSSRSTGDRIGQRLTLRVVRAGELREVELIPLELED